jgi:hypothetical protein
MVINSLNIILDLVNDQLNYMLQLNHMDQFIMVDFMHHHV